MIRQLRSARVRLQMQTIGSQSVSKLDVAHALALASFVAQRVPRPFPDRLALPLTDRAHAW